MPTIWLGRQNTAPLQFDTKPSEAASSAVFWLPWQRGWAKRYTALPEMQSFRIKRLAFRLVPPIGGLLVFCVILLMAITPRPTTMYLVVLQKHIVFVCTVF